jgi:putative flippase GtrA
MIALRYLLVSALGEVTYLALFAIASWAGLSTLVAITLAGAFCVIQNGFLHARISFRVRFCRTILRDYLAVQLLCMAAALGSGALMEKLGAKSAVIAVVTWVLWAGASFLLTRWRYRQAN